MGLSSDEFKFSEFVFDLMQIQSPSLETEFKFESYFLRSEKKADNGFSRHFMLEDELNFDTIKFREMARPFIRYFKPLLNGPRNEKIGCKHYL